VSIAGTTVADGGPGWPLQRWPIRIRGLGLALGVSLVFLVAHLFFLAPTPASVDGVNFLLGVREFNIGDHRPHPPGSPLFIALGKASRLVLRSSPQQLMDRVRVETRALAVWSAILGSLAALPLLAIFRRLGSERRAWAATLLTLASPLFWMLAVRPLSDMAGLTVGLTVQALLLMSLDSGQDPLAREAGRRFVLRRYAAVAAALLSGLAIGIRSQTVWLTVPLLAFCGYRLWQTHRARVGAMGVAFVIGVLIWGVPLLMASGGIAGYAAAFQSQAAEHWRDDVILATSPTPARFARAVNATFGSPFADGRVAIGAIAFALIGMAVTLRRGREGAMWIAALYGPYLLFHLIFQETSDARYALPIVPALAYLVVGGLDVVAGRFMPWMVGAFIALCLSIVVPPVVVYANSGNPVFRALGDVQAELAQYPSPADRPVLAMHHAVSRMLRGQQTPMQTLPSRPRKEWRELVRYWRRGGTSPVWFLAERGRTDLALIDRASRRIVRTYAWPFENRSLMTSARPRGIVWHEIRPPGWMVDEGWALTPETGGVAFADRRGPSEQPIQAFVRRRAEPVTLLIGGRISATPGEPAPRIKVWLDGLLVDSWIEEGSAFLKTWHLPAGHLAGTGPYATLEVVADSPASRARVTIDQFDAQPDGSLLYGFDSGWYELELDPRTGQSWRWTDRRASLRIHPGDRDVIVRLDADRPLDYLPGPPQIVARVGYEIVTSMLADAHENLTLSFRISRAALKRADGLVSIEIVSPFVRQFKALDPNRPFPGLRVFDLTIAQAQPGS
jgi:hypothetical protein